MRNRYIPGASPPRGQIKADVQKHNERNPAKEDL